MKRKKYFDQIRRRMLAGGMAAMLAVTSVPTNAVSLLAAEYTEEAAEEIIVESETGTLSETSGNQAQGSPSQGDDVTETPQGLEILDITTVEEEAIPEEVRLDAQSQPESVGPLENTELSGAETGSGTEQKIPTELEMLPVSDCLIENLEIIEKDNIVARLSYEDGSAEEIALDYSGSGNDSYGNTVRVALYQGENQIENWYDLKAGDYTIRLSCGTLVDQQGLTVVPLAEYIASLEQLTLGQPVTITSPQENTRYDYAFTALADGTYAYRFNGAAFHADVYDGTGGYMGAVWFGEGETDEKRLSVSMQAGQTYLLRMNADLGCRSISVCVEEGVAVEGIRVNAPEQTVAGNLFAGLSVTLSYAGENIPEQTINLWEGGDVTGFRDSYGNQIELEWTSTSGNIGTFTGAIRCGGITQEFTLNVISRLDSGQEFPLFDLTGIEEGAVSSQEITIEPDGAGYLKVVPEQSGDYRFTRSDGGTNIEIVDAKENSLGYEGIAGGMQAQQPYLLCLYNYSTEAVTMTVQAEKKKALKRMEIKAPLKFSDWWMWLNDEVTAVLTYEDDSQQEIGVYDSDSEGRRVAYTLYDAAGEEVYDFENLPYGSYTVVFTCGAITQELQVEHLSREDAAVQLQLGENVLENSEGWFEVCYTVPEAGYYRFAVSGGWGTWQNENNKYPSMPFAGYFEAGEKVLCSVGREEGSAALIVTVSKVPVITQIELTIPETLMGIGCLRSVQATYTYENEEFASETVWLGDILQSGYQPKIMLDGAMVEDVWGDVTPGEYTLTVEAGGASASQKITVLDEWANRQQLVAGENTLTLSAENDTLCYFVPEKENVGYRFEAESTSTVDKGYIYGQDGNIIGYVSYGDTPALSLTAGKRYRIDLSLAEGEPDTEITFRITEVPRVSKVQIYPARTDFWVGIDSVTMHDFEMTYEYSDGRTHTMKCGTADEYGYRVNTITLSDASGMWTDSLPSAGRYEAQINFGESYYKVPFEAKEPSVENFPELAVGQQVEIPPQSTVFYVFKPQQAGRYYFASDYVSYGAYDAADLAEADISGDGSLEMQEGGAYYIRLHNNWDLTRSFTIVSDEQRHDLQYAVIDPIPDYTQTGMDIEPDVSVRIGDTYLTRDTDYTVQCDNCVDPGEATVTITGIGDYTGSKTISFRILPGTITTDSIWRDSFAEGETVAPEEGHGTVWYDWYPRQSGVYVIDAAGNASSLRLYEEQADRSLKNVSDKLYHADEQTYLFHAQSDKTYYFQLLKDVRSFRAAVPAELTENEQAEQIPYEGESSWSFTPLLDGTYKIISGVPFSVRSFSGELSPLPEITVEQTDKGYAGTCSLIAGETYLFLVSADAQTHTISIESTQVQVPQLEVGSNLVHLPAGAAATYQLPYTSAADGRFYAAAEGMHLNFSVGTKEEQAQYTRTGSGIGYRETEGLFLTVENISQETLESLEIGKVPEVTWTIGGGWTEETSPQEGVRITMDAPPQWAEALADQIRIKAEYTFSDGTSRSAELAVGAQDAYGFVWVLDKRSESGQVQPGTQLSYLISQLWMEEGIQDEKHFTVNVISPEEVPQLTRMHADHYSYLPKNKAAVYSFTPVITGNYLLTFDAPVKTALTPQDTPEAVETRVIPVTAGEVCTLLIIPEKNDGAEITYHLYREGAEGQIAISEIKPQTYTGEYLTAELTVTDSVSGYALLEGVDYTVKNTQFKYAGEYSVEVKGIGEYAGYVNDSVWQTFEILPAPFEDVVFPETEEYVYIYTGEPLYYKEDGNYNGSLVTDRQYRQQDNGEDITSAGVKTVTLEGKDDFVGTQEVTYEILRKNISDGRIKITGDATYTGAPVTPQFAVVAEAKNGEEKTLVPEQDYTAEFSDNIEVGRATLTVTGCGNYQGTLTHTFWIEPKSIEELTVDPIPAQIYDGTAKTPEVIVRYGDMILEKGKDYTVTYADNVKIGTASVNIVSSSGGNYTGRKTVTFEIKNETRPTEGVDPQPYEYGKQYEAAAQEQWYSLKSDAQTLLYLETAGDAAAPLTLFERKGDTLHRLWTQNSDGAQVPSVTAAALGAARQTDAQEKQGTLAGASETGWFIPLQGLEEIWLCVPAGMSLYGETAATLSSGQEIGGAQRLYRVPSGVEVSLFAQRESALRAVSVQDKAVSSFKTYTLHQNRSYLSENREKTAEKYAYRLDISGGEAAQEQYVILEKESGTYWSEILPDITKIEMDAKKQSFRRFDQDYFAGTSIKVSYADGTSQTLENGGRDSWGRLFTADYQKEGGALRQETVTDRPDYLLDEGSYTRIVRALSEDQAQGFAEAVDTFTVLPFEESYVENTVKAGDKKELLQETSILAPEIYPFEIARGWTYVLTADAPITLYPYNENGAAGDPVTTDSCELELAEGTYYYCIVSNGATKFDFTEKAPLKKIESITANGDVKSIRVSWSTAVELDTGYRLYRRAEGEQEFALIAEIPDRGATFWEDKDAEEHVTYEYYVIATKGKYLVSEPSDIDSAAIIEDKEAPNVVELACTGGARINKTVTFTMRAEDNLAVERCEIQRKKEGDIWETLAQSDGDTCSYEMDTTKYADGMIELRAMAWDRSGNASAGLRKEFEIDNSGPEKVANVSVKATTSTTVTLQWDDVADEDFSYFAVEEKQEDGTWKQIAVSPATLGTNLTDLAPDSTHTYRVAAYDLLGNRGEYSEEIAVTTTQDDTNPVNSRISPTEGYFTKEIPLTLGGSDDCGVAAMEAQIKTENGDWKSVQSWQYDGSQKRVTQQYTLDVSAVQEGKLRVRAIVTDTAGRKSDTSNLAPFAEYVVDRTAPAAPQLDRVIGRNGYIELAWTQGAEEDLAGYAVYRSAEEDGAYVLIEDGLQAIGYADATAKAGTKWYYRLKAKDLAGNESEWSQTLGAAMAQDTQKPQIRSVVPAEGETLGSAYRTVRMIATDNGALAAAKARYSVNDEAYRELPAVTMSGSQADAFFEIPLEKVVHGASIKVEIEVFDAAGNKNKIIRTYTTDLEAPSVEAAKAVYDETQKTVVLTWQEGLESDLAGYRIYRKRTTGDAWKLIAQRKAQEGQEQSYTDLNPELEALSYVYRIEAADELGNVSAQETNEVALPDRSMPKPVIDCESTMEQGVEYRISAARSTDNTGIASYEFDMGDGTVSRSVEAIHVWDEPGDYTIALKVTDTDGNTAVCEKAVTVRERKLLGSVKALVQGTDGRPIPHAPVYFDLGEENMFVRTTGADGTVLFTAETGVHAVGCVIGNNEYLPQQKNVVVSANSEASLVFTMVKQPIIEGKFEIHRMTLEEIKAAGIDIDDPENQYIAKITVHLQYGSKPVKLDVMYRPDKGDIIYKPVFVPDDDGDDDDGRVLIPNIIGPIGGGGGSIGGGSSDMEDVSVGILDIPVGASVLKEFFDVKLHIINNSSSEFSMKDNIVRLNVPNGLSIMDTENTQAEAAVEIPQIQGQTQTTINWILRGDQVGKYYLSADYSGVLDKFGVPMTAQFKAEEPIEVFGMTGMKLTMYIAKELKEDQLYFDLELRNDSERDVYKPDIFADDDSKLVYQEYFSGDTLLDMEPSEVIKTGERLIRHYSRNCSGLGLDEAHRYLQKYWASYGAMYGLEFEIVPKALSWFRAADETVTLTFDSQGGTKVAPLKDLPKGKTFDEIEDEETQWPIPKKEGLYFAGWYTAPNDKGTLFDKGTELTVSMTLYARWSQESNEFGSLLSKVGKDEYGLHFVNSKGKPLKDVSVTFNGEKQKTDGDGDVVFKKPSKETAALKAQKEGYEDYSNKEYELKKTRVDCVILYTEGEREYMLEKAMYYVKNDDSVDKKDILQKNLRLYYWKDSDGEIVDDPEFALDCYVNPSSWQDFLRIELYQGKKLIASADEIAPSGKVTIDGLYIRNFTSGSGVYVKTVFRRNGGEYTMKNNLLMDLISPADFDLDLGGGFKIAIDKGVPLVGGMEIGMDLPNFPLIYKAKRDGTIVVGLNIKDAFFSSDEDKLKEVEDFFDDFKTLGSTESVDDKFKEIKKESGGNSNVDTGLIGYFEGQLTREGKFGKLSGHVILTLDASYGYKHPIMIGPVPVTLEVDVSGSAEAHGRAGYDLRKEKWDFGVDTKMSLGVEGFAGVGLTGVMALGGYAGGEIALALEKLLVPKSLDVTASGGFKAYAGPFEYNWKLLEKTWPIFPKTEKNQAILLRNAMEAYNIEVYEYVDRDYLDKQSDWMGEVPGVSSGAVSPLLTETYGGAKPQIITAGGTTVMVYTGDTKDAGRSAANMGQLMYSVYRNGGWSAPKPVDNNEYADGTFRLYADGDAVYLTYQEATKVFDDTINRTPEQYFAALGVTTAEFDAASESFINFNRVGDAGRYNSQPDTAANGARQMTVWVSNTSADCFGANKTNEIRMQITENGTSETKTLRSGLNSVTALRAGVLGGSFAAAYIVDGDNDLNTAEDRSLYLIREDGTQTKLAEGLIARPEFTKVPGETQTSLVWYEGGALKYYTAFGEGKTLVQGVNADYQITGDYVLYIGANENGAANVYAIVYRDGRWSEPLFVTDQTQDIYSIHAAQIDGQIGLVLMQNEKTGEGEQAQDHYTMGFLMLRDTHSLRLVSALYDESLAAPGATVLVEFMVQNTGTALVTSLEAKITDADGNIAAQQTYELTLGASQRTSLTIPMQVPQTLKGGDHTLAVRESGRDWDKKNEYSVSFAKTDLELTAEVSRIGSMYEIVAQVTNIGHRASGGTLRITGSGSENGETILYEAQIETLEPQEDAVYGIRLDSSEFKNDEDTLEITVTSDAADYSTFNNTCIEMIYRTYNVSYYVGGKIWRQESLEKGSVLVFPPRPEGDTAFLGWYSIADGTKAEENMQITSSLELEARFADAIFSITQADGKVTMTDDVREIVKQLSGGEGVTAELLADVTLDQSLTVAAGNTLLISPNAALTVAGTGSIENNGTILADGVLVNEGRIVNTENMAVSGTFTNKGSVSSSGTFNNNGLTINESTIENSGNIYNNSDFNTEKGQVTGSGMFLNAGKITGEANIESEISTHVHVWSSAYTVDREPTCTQNGSQSKHCTVDGCLAGTQPMELPAAGHKYGEWSVRTEPTLTEKGVKVRVCAACGNTDTQDIPNLTDQPHEMTELVVESYKGAYDGTPHTVTMKGVPKDAVVTWYETQGGEPLEAAPAYVKEGLYTIWYRAEKEGYRTVEGSAVIEIAPCKHQFAPEWTQDQAPTETQAGSKSRHCMVTGCAGRTDVTIIPALGSVYADMQETLEQMKPEDAQKGDNPEILQSYVDTILQADSAQEVAEQIDMDTVQLLESMYLASLSGTAAGGKPLVTDSKTSLRDAAGNVIENTQMKVEGAALTAAKAAKELVQEENISVAAKLLVQMLSEEKITEKDLQERVKEGSAVVFDITLDVMNTENNEVLAENVQPSAPIRITLPIPAELQYGKNFVLLHQGENGSEEIAYTKDEAAQTITFTTGALSLYVLSAGECSEHEFSVEVSRTEPTCVKAGWITKKCKYCTETINEPIAATGKHAGGKATCQQKAVCDTCGQEYGELGAHTGGTATCQKRAVCTVCKQEYGELGKHKLGAATCGHGQICEVCKQEFGEPVGKHTGGAATCQKRAVCEVCGQEYGELGVHTGGAATCRKRAVCTVCKQEYGGLAAHRGGTATCQKRAVCADCGQEYGALGGHSFSATWTVDKSATCAAAGSRSQRCTIAGCTAKQNIQAIPATGKHTYGAWSTAKKPTALAQGSETRKCSVCAQTQSRSIAKLTPTIEVNATSIPLKVKQSTTKLKVSGLAEGDYVASWKSSDKKIVKVNSKGKLTAQKKTGKATITITLASGLEKTVKVTVQKTAVQTKKITGLKKKLTMKKKQKEKLLPQLLPITTLDKVKYSSSNKKVVTVNSKGMLVAKKAGTAKITVEAGKKKFKITVKVK